MTTPTDLPDTDHTVLHVVPGAPVRQPEHVVPQPDSARALLTGAGIDLETFDAHLDELLGGAR